MSLFEVQKGFNRQGLAYLDYINIQGSLTDTAVAAADTVAGLRAITFVGYEVQRRMYEQYQRHIDFLEAIGVLTDAAILSLTTVADLEALLTTADSSLSIIGNKSYVM